MPTRDDSTFSPSVGVPISLDNIQNVINHRNFGLLTSGYALHFRCCETVPCPTHTTPLSGQVDQVRRTLQIPVHCRPRKASGLLNINPQSETVCTLCCAIPMCMLTLLAYRFCSPTLPQNIRRHLDVWKCAQIAPTRNPAGHGRLHLSRRRRDEIHIRTRQSLMRASGSYTLEGTCVIGPAGCKGAFGRRQKR